MTTTIINEETGEPITRITVMRSFTYDVERIIPLFRDDNRLTNDEPVTADDVIQYALSMGIEDFYEVRLHTKDLVLIDQDGNEL